MTAQIDADLGRPRRTGPPLCVHHWIVDAAEGAESNGRCKHCGEERCFSNSLETEGWASARDDAGDGRLVQQRAARRTELADEI